MRTAIQLFVAVALATGGATVAFGQVASTPAGGGGAAPGTGDSTTITSGNRQNNAEYNHLINSGNDKPKADDERRVRHQPAVAATAADIKAGAALRDIKGVPIGTVVSVDAEQAVVDTGQTKIGVPLVAFGKDDRGLMLAMTADKFGELVAKARAH